MPNYDNHERVYYGAEKATKNGENIEPWIKTTKIMRTYYSSPEEASHMLLEEVKKDRNEGLQIAAALVAGTNIGNEIYKGADLDLMLNEREKDAAEQGRQSFNWYASRNPIPQYKKDYVAIKKEQIQNKDKGFPERNDDR